MHDKTKAKAKPLLVPGLVQTLDRLFFFYQVAMATCRDQHQEATDNKQHGGGFGLVLDRSAGVDDDDDTVWKQSMA